MVGLGAAPAAQHLHGVPGQVADLAEMRGACEHQLPRTAQGCIGRLPGGTEGLGQLLSRRSCYDCLAYHNNSLCLGASLQLGLCPPR